MIEITELDELLNTLATSALEPHEEYKMEFSNREQKLIYDYIKSLQQENQQLKEQNEDLLNQNRELRIKLEHYIPEEQYKDMLNRKNQQLKQRDEVIDEAIDFIKEKINKSFNYDYGLDTSNPTDRLFTETVIELQCILDKLQKYKGDNK